MKIINVGPRAKRYIFTTFKIIVSMAILYFLSRKLDFESILETYIRFSRSVLLIIVLTAVLKLIIEIFNWALYLRLNPAYRGKLPEILRSHLIGHAFRFLIPGGHATLGKIYFVQNDKISGAIAVFIEKFYQTWVYFLFAAFSAVFFFPKFSLFPKLMLFFIITWLPVLLYFTKIFIKKSTYKPYYRKYLKIIPLVSGLQILYMMITVFQYYLLLNNIQRINFFASLQAVSLLQFANVIPITYSGLGLRESFAVKTLPVFGISAELAVATSLVVFLINSVVPALSGVFILTFTSKNNQESDSGCH